MTDEHRVSSSRGMHLALHLTPEAFYGQTCPAASSGGMALPGEAPLSFFRQDTDECISLAANVKTLLAAHPEWNSAEYSSVDILVETLRYTMVPLELFDEDLRKDLFSCNFDLREEEQIRHNILPACNAVALFAADRFAMGMLLDPFPQARIQVQAAVGSEYFCRLNKVEGPSELYAVMQEERLHAFVYAKGELQTAASFQCLSADDAAYFLLSLMKQNEMDVRSHSLHLAGQGEWMAEAEALLRRFVRFVDVLPMPFPEKQTFFLHALQQIQNS